MHHVRFRIDGEPPWILQKPPRLIVEREIKPLARIWFIAIRLAPLGRAVDGHMDAGFRKFANQLVHLDLVDHQIRADDLELELGPDTRDVHGAVDRLIFEHRRQREGIVGDAPAGDLFVPRPRPADFRIVGADTQAVRCERFAVILLGVVVHQSLVVDKRCEHLRVEPCRRRLIRLAHDQLLTGGRGRGRGQV